MNPERKRLGVAGFVILLCALGFLGIRFLRKSPLLDVAQKATLGMLHGDGQAMFETSSGFERDCSNLSPKMIDDAWRILVGPHVEGSKVVSIGSPEMSSNKVQASSQVNLENPQGIHWGIAMISNKTDSGAASQIVFAMLDVAGRFDHNGRVIEMTPGSQLDALRLNRKKLEAAGLHSILLRPGACLSLDELDALLAKHVQPSP